MQLLDKGMSGIAIVTALLCLCASLVSTNPERK